MAVRVKICGITNAADAHAAVDAGADALGFMFYPPSPRDLTFSQAAKIVQSLPPLVAKVGVFVNPTEADVRQAISDVGIDTLQFHGDESPEFCRRFPLKVIKAFRIRDASSLSALAGYPGETWLLDAFVEGKLGGTGARFEWDLASQAVATGGRVILAGGLTPDNVGEAVRKVNPFGVDVSSGVEASPGKKDAEKVRRFIAEAKRS